jgi:CheY-like chemotaxis protein
VTTLADGGLICRECLHSRIAIGIQKSVLKLPGGSEFAAFGLEPGHEEIGTKCRICGVALEAVEPVCRINGALSHLVCTQLEHGLTNNRRILLVESEEGIREVVCSMLASSGVDCLEAISGREAIDLLATGARVDLILSSVLMADIDGWTLFLHIKTHYPSTPFVFLTTATEPSIREAAAEEGADGFLLMPCRPEELLETVRMALGKSQSTGV